MLKLESQRLLGLSKKNDEDKMNLFVIFIHITRTGS